MQAIYLIADSWDSVTQETIIHCWKKAGITGQPETSTGERATREEVAGMEVLGPSTANTLLPVKEFINREQQECRQALGSLQDNGLDEYQDFESFFDSYFADQNDEKDEEGDSSVRKTVC